MEPETIQPETREPQTVVIRRESVTDVMLSSFAALGYAVSARFLLFLSLLGAFALSVMAMNSQTVNSIVVVTLFCLLTVMPLVSIELYNRIRKD